MIKFTILAESTKVRKCLREKRTIILFSKLNLDMINTTYEGIILLDVETKIFLRGFYKKCKISTIRILLYPFHFY